MTQCHHCLLFFQYFTGPAIPPPPSVDINKLRRKITEVIRTNYAGLSKTLKSNIPAIAKEMYARGLLSEAVKDHPTYDSLMREFEAGLNFKKTVKAIEEHCQSFIASVSSQKGPAESHARAIADEWKDGVMKELKITFMTGGGWKKIGLEIEPSEVLEKKRE